GREVARHGFGTGIHPVDRLVVCLHVARDDILLGRQILRVGDLHANGLLANGRDIAGATDHAGCSRGKEVEHERRHRPADVHLTGHDLGDVPGTSPVATGLALRPYSLMNRSTVMWEDAPVVEYAMLWPSTSRIERKGDLAATHQKVSLDPVELAPMMRSGAPLP